MRRWTLLGLIVGVVMLGTLLPASAASFTSTSRSSIRATTDTVSHWLHLYSESTDPDGLDGYAHRRSPSAPAVPAATGADDGLQVDLGVYAPDNNVQLGRVFTIEAAATFPVGSSIAVAATFLPDPVTGEQPIQGLGFREVGKDNGTPNPVNVSSGEKLQANLRLKLRLDPGVYRPSALITVTYTGMTAVYFQYVVPITVRVDPTAVTAAASQTAPQTEPLDGGVRLDTSWDSTPTTSATGEQAAHPEPQAPAPGSEWLPVQESAAPATVPAHDPASF